MKTRTANASILMHTVRALRPQLQMRALKKKHRCSSQVPLRAHQILLAAVNPPVSTSFSNEAKVCSRACFCKRTRPDEA